MCIAVCIACDLGVIMLDYVATRRGLFFDSQLAF